MLRTVRVTFNRFFSSDKEFAHQIRELIGFTPSNLAVFKLAFRHSSFDPEANSNNERLEYLGDAVLDTIISTFLFKKYPKKGEGFLTETRSKIVSRKKLGEIAHTLGLQDYLAYNQNYVTVSPTMMGNALEALIGAVFVDAGYDKTKTFVMQQIIVPYIDLEVLQQTEFNYKSKLLEWSQKYNKDVKFELLEQKVVDGHNRVFTVGIKVDGKIVSKGNGKNKKTAQKEAARHAFAKLEINADELVTT